MAHSSRRITDGVHRVVVTQASAEPLVDELLRRCTFPVAGTPVDCAVSGGPDSTALLVLACAAGCVVTAHHVDHGLRPSSSCEVRLVADIAERFGATLVAHQVEVGHGPNLEARARKARYAVLPGRVMTGHTLDDRAETVLLNMLRGAASKGMSPMRSTQRHPIRSLRRTETVQLCEALGLRVVDDPSNEDPAYQRNRVRHELLPLMRSIANRDVAAILDRQADVLAAEDELLDTLASELDATDAKAIAAADPALARRALRNWIETEWSVGHPPDAGAVGRAIDVARGDATASDIGLGHRVYRSNQRLRIEPPSLP